MKRSDGSGAVVGDGGSSRAVVGGGVHKRSLKEMK